MQNQARDLFTSTTPINTFITHQVPFAHSIFAWRKWINFTWTQPSVTDGKDTYLCLPVPNSYDTRPRDFKTIILTFIHVISQEYFHFVTYYIKINNWTTLMSLFAIVRGSLHWGHGNQEWTDRRGWPSLEVTTVFLTPNFSRVPLVVSYLPRLPWLPAIMGTVIWYRCHKLMVAVLDWQWGNTLRQLRYKK